MKRLYVLVRNDLKRSSPAVQAGHAVAEFMLKYPDCEWNNNYLIYLRIRNLEDLEYWNELLDNTTKAIFHEPDLSNEMTAIAVYGTDP